VEDNPASAKTRNLHAALQQQNVDDVAKGQNRT
jgi:hypothetical protein